MPLNVTRRTKSPVTQSVICADCREVMLEMGNGTVDAVITDPPYGISYSTNWRKATAKPKAIAGDGEPPLWCISEFFRLLKDGGAIYIATRFDVFPAWADAVRSAGFKLKTTIVWDKQNHTSGDLTGDYGCRTELFIFAHKGRHVLRNGRPQNLISIPRPRACAHPTPKPPELMRHFIRNSTSVGDTVLDPFVGSGATAVACKMENRNCIAIDLDKNYCDMAISALKSVQR